MLHIVGGGGFGRETLDCLIALGYALTGVVFVDDGKAGQTVRGLPVLSLDLVGEGEYVVAISNPVLRRRLAAALTERGLTPRTIIHPQAMVGPETTVGAGSVVLAGAYVSSSVVLGEHVQINYNATVGHDAVLEDYVTVLPGANVSGSVRLCEGVTMGTGSQVIQGLTVKRGTFVGAGAVVVRDQEADLVLVGVPARPLAN